jgi:hypothetical protein
VRESLWLLHTSPFHTLFCAGGTGMNRVAPTWLKVDLPTVDGLASLYEASAPP